MIAGRRRSVIFFIVLGACLVAIAVTLNVSWLVLNWREGVLAVLGVIFFPLTTLMYVLLWSPNGLNGFDWVWLALAFVLDIGGALGSAYGNRDRMPIGA